MAHACTIDRRPLPLANHDTCARYKSVFYFTEGQTFTTILSYNSPSIIFNSLLFNIQQARWQAPTLTTHFENLSSYSWASRAVRTNICFMEFNTFIKLNSPPPFVGSVYEIWIRECLNRNLQGSPSLRSYHTRPMQNRVNHLDAYCVWPGRTAVFSRWICAFLMETNLLNF